MAIGGKHVPDRTPRREHAVHVPGQARRPCGLEWSYLGEEGHGGKKRIKLVVVSKLGLQ